SAFGAASAEPRLAVSWSSTTRSTALTAVASSSCQTTMGISFRHWIGRFSGATRLVSTTVTSGGQKVRRFGLSCSVFGILWHYLVYCLRFGFGVARGSQGAVARFSLAFES